MISEERRYQIARMVRNLFKNYRVKTFAGKRALRVFSSADCMDLDVREVPRQDAKRTLSDLLKLN